MVVPIIGSSGYTLMISFHKIIGGYLSPFATSFALRLSGSIRRHMCAIKHPLESETEFPQRRRTCGHPVHPSLDIFESLFSQQLQTYIKAHWIRCSVLVLNVNYFFKVRIVEQHFKWKLSPSQRFKFRTRFLQNLVIFIWAKNYLFFNFNIVEW